MNDVPNPAPADDAALLAAYLDAELDAEAAAALEARLAAESQLAADLETERELRELLGGASVPEPPAGFDERLRARLDEEQQAAAPARSVASLSAARQRRRPINWAAMGGIAAALVAVAVVGASVLTQGAGDSGGEADMAMEALSGDDTDTGDSAREFFADDAADGGAMEQEAADEGGDVAASAPSGAATEEGEDAATLDSAETEAATEERTQAHAGAAPQEPVIVSEGTVLSDEQAVRAHLSGRPEVEALLGMSGQEATDTAAAFRVAVQRAEPFPSGVHPAACLDTVAADTQGTVAPVRVEEVTYAGEPSLLYVLVLATGDTLDRVEGWVVAPDSCATGLFVNLR